MQAPLSQVLSSVNLIKHRTRAVRDGLKSMRAAAINVGDRVPGPLNRMTRMI